MQITVKLFFQDEIRRVSIGDENGDLTISHLKSTIDAIFPALKHGDFRLLWKDEDGDFVTISSNVEFLDAVKEMTANGLAKFHIKAAQETVEQLPSSGPTDHCAAGSSELESVHDGVQCDECGILPIVGPRFKCSVRNDFDLCAACEAKGPQPHPMIKMNAPKRSFSPFRGFPGFGGRAGRGGGRCGGRFGGNGRFGGWFGGGDPDHPPTPPHEGGPPGSFHHHPPGPHGPFGGRGRGCEWREALRRRMERDHQPTPQDCSPPVAAPVPTAATTKNPAVHLGVGCDGCRMSPIVGTRYKCAVREDYDLCAACESRRCTDGGLTAKDLFPMLKIDRLDQAPGTFVYIFNKRAVLGCHMGGRGHGHHGTHGHHGHHGHGGRHPSNSVFMAVHRHVNCDHCGAHPITGPRFKCAVRPDFDLCSSCAATVPQPYPMVKIYHPQHRPSTVVYAAALSAAAAQPQQQQPLPGSNVHQGVRCDECKVCPIVGARFQCTGRDDYDLCGACEALKAHQPFPMVKIMDSTQRPKDFVYEVRGAKPVASRTLTHPSVQTGIRCDECHQSPILGPRYKCAVRDDFDLCSACEAKRVQPYPTVKIYDPQHHPSKLVFAFYDRLAPAAAAPAAPVPHVPTVASAEPTLPRPSLRFVRDRSLPDGTAVQPGQTGLRKIWDVRNDGLHAWPAGSTLVFCGGDVLHSGTAPAVEPARLLKPGEEGQLAVSLTAVPEKDGRYVSYFRMQTAEGQNFGQRLWADIVVTKPASPVLPAAPSTERSPFVQAMDEHMKQHVAAHTAERAPFIQGMDAHMKELQRLEALARQAQEQEDRRLAEELDALQLQGLEGAVDEEEEEKLLQQVMAEHQQQQVVEGMSETSPSVPTPSEVVEDVDAAAPSPLQVSVEAEPVDCVPALAELSPVPSEKGDSELTEGWAVLVATAADKDGACEYLLEEPESDNDDCASEYSAGVHQPASTSSSALMTASTRSNHNNGEPNSSSIMTASYANACADLDLFDESSQHSQHSQHDHLDHHQAHEQDHQLLEYMEDSVEESSSAAVESKEPEPESVVTASAPEPTPVTAPVSDAAARVEVYQRELQMLGEMGFADVEVLVPLLQKHLRADVEGGGVDAQGLHAVLAELLN
uniref:Uncharacterized protein n=1 Tax=Spumella elongata TaxID=89044 RepID=A0A7S3HT26_9STRA|mmetsp:Transcript_8981/g.15344  ORF Transcript_8981/g.15344 Transcript_8981/m.15344 type:complete len:1126 (+) Transcript_8981:85-3462(+)